MFTRLSRRFSAIPPGNTPRRLAFACCTLCVAFQPLAARAKVTLTTPELIDEFRDYQAVLDEYAQTYCDDIADIVGDSLDKPLFMEGFASAAGVSSLVSAAVREPGLPSLSVGSAAAVYADSLGPSLASELSSLDPESDMRAGLCVQPVVVNMGATLPFFGKKTYAGLSFGYIDADTGAYGIKALSAGGFAGARVFAGRPSLLTWEGLTLELGGEWAATGLSTVAKPGTITQEVGLDPDADGPLVPQYVTLRVNPDIKAGIETNMIALRASAKTGVTFFRALTLTAGGGVAWSYARSGITVETQDQIVIDSYLGQLVKEGQNGSIAIEGTAATLVSRHVIPYFQGGASFRVGSFSLSVPVVWKPGEALGSGLFVGLSL